METRTLNQALSLDLPQGLMVVSVTKKSLLAGVVKGSQRRSIHNHSIPWGGDILVAIDDQPLSSLVQARRLLWKIQAKTAVTLSFKRFSGARVRFQLKRSTTASSR